MDAPIKFEHEDQVGESFSLHSSDTLTRKRNSSFLSGSPVGTPSFLLPETVSIPQMYSCVGQNRSSEVPLVHTTDFNTQGLPSTSLSLSPFALHSSSPMTISPSDSSFVSNNPPSYSSASSSLTPSYSSLESDRRKRYAYMNPFSSKANSFEGSIPSPTLFSDRVLGLIPFESPAATALSGTTESSYMTACDTCDDFVEQRECNDSSDANSLISSATKSGTNNPIKDKSASMAAWEPFPASSINSASEKEEDELYEELSSVVASAFGEEGSTADTTQSLVSTDRVGSKSSEKNVAGASASTSPSPSASTPQPGQSATLPITNIGRIMKRTLPENAKVTKESKEMIQDSVTEFIQYITADASEHCASEKRKTINSDDVIWAMQQRGLTQYVEHLLKFLKRLRSRTSSSVLTPKAFQEPLNQSNGLNGNTKHELRNTSSMSPDGTKFEMSKSSLDEIGKISGYSESLGQFEYHPRYVTSQHEANVRNAQMPKSFSPGQAMLPSNTVPIPHQLQRTYQMQQNHQFQRAYQIQQAILSQQQAASHMQEPISMRQPTLQMHPHSASFRQPPPSPSPPHTGHVHPHHLSAIPLCRPSDSQHSAMSFANTTGGRMSVANTLHHVRTHFRSPPTAAGANYFGEGNEQHSSRSNVPVTLPHGKGNGLTELGEYPSNSSMNTSQASMGSKAMS